MTHWLKYLWLMLIAFVSCQRDFDEWNDTEQRQVTISVCLEDMFDSVLIPRESGICMENSAPENKLANVRLSINCYDEESHLVDRKITFLQPESSNKTTIRHLNRNQKYQFVAVADVVVYKEENDYEEVWYHIHYDSLPKYQLVSFQQNDDPAYNRVKMASFSMTPENQDTIINLSSLTFNGYVEFLNADDVRKISGWTRKSSSIALYEKQSRSESQFEYALYPNNSSSVISPITCNVADKMFRLNVKMFYNNGNNSNDTIIIHNNGLKNFVVKYDCLNSDYQCVYY